MKLLDTVSLPVWALCAVLYGDYSGLDDDQIELVEENIPENVVIDPEVESDFTINPWFGMACDCVNANIYEV